MRKMARMRASVRTLAAPEALASKALTAPRASASVMMAMRYALAALMVLALLCVQPRVALAEPNTTIVGLVNAGQQLDGQEVVIEGEVVGDIIAAENGHRWLMLQDGGASISVLISEDDLDKVVRLGRYGQIGTRLEVTGEFRTDCVEHQGLVDVHATKLVVLDEGTGLTERVDVRKLQVGGLLVVIGGCLLVLHWRLREKTR